jgi:hypothetical protein
MVYLAVAIAVGLVAVDFLDFSSRKATRQRKI